MRVWGGEVSGMCEACPEPCILNLGLALNSESGQLGPGSTSLSPVPCTLLPKPRALHPTPYTLDLGNVGHVRQRHDLAVLVRKLLYQRHLLRLPVSAVR